MSPRLNARRALSVLSTVAFACGSNGDGTARSADTLAVGRDGGPPFIAEATDFAGFHDWESFSITDDIAPGDTHINGPRHVFIKRAPPKGSTAFPVGTVIVKESDVNSLGEPIPVTQRIVFASVKRGGDYDPTGDVNWEWFSLQNMPDGSETILWRGPGPASGGVYGNGSLGGCNACHGGAKSSDYVLTPQLEAMILPPSD